MNLPYRKREIAPDIFSVGVQDWQRRDFDGIVPLPYGTSYNAYLVKGAEKTALIDTTNPEFEDELVARIETILPVGSIDYIIMNHIEPDHSFGIPHMMKLAPNARLVCSIKGAEMATSFYRVPDERKLVVKQDDTIDLGGKTLKFIEAPWLHWPETMFTFCVEDSVLFPCDFFGSHIASDMTWADKVGDILMPEAKRYYADIMMPFTRMVTAGLNKTAALNPSVIAPSHGPVYRNPQPIIDAYEKWSRGPLLAKAVIPYVSMWGSTRLLAEAVIQSLSSEGIEVVPYDLLEADSSHIARDMVDASALVLGAPTVLGGLHPKAAYIVTLAKALRPRLKLAAYFGSCGWGGGAASQVKTFAETAKLTVVDALEIVGRPYEDEIARAVQLGANVAQAIRENLA